MALNTIDALANNLSVNPDVALTNIQVFTGAGSAFAYYIDNTLNSVASFLYIGDKASALVANDNWEYIPTPAGESQTVFTLDGLNFTNGFRMYAETTPGVGGAPVNDVRVEILYS